MLSEIRQRKTNTVWSHSYPKSERKKKTTTILVEKVFIVPLERVPEKPLLLLYWLRQNLWLCGSQQTGKFVKRWEHQTTLPASWEICM